ncbi:hypothetical protein C8J56DRAFT_337343 [Mycena floridula]|nr:hypothetical protein C8J56DRAFT_337343 [Mycena floridula]
MGHHRTSSTSSSETMTDLHRHTTSDCCCEGGDIAVPEQPVAEPSGGPSIWMPPSSVEKLEHKRLIPMIPENARYRRQDRIQYKDPDFTVKPGQLIYQSFPPLPRGWTRHVNSEGQPFFYNERKNVVTENWMHNSEVAQHIERFADYLLACSEFFPELAGSQLNVAKWYYPDLNNKLDDDGWRGFYYFAHHEKRLLWWIEEYTINDHLRDVGGDMSPEHAKLMIERQYWKHFEIFDDVQRPTDRCWDELQDIVDASCADVLSAVLTTCSLSLDDLQSWSHIIKSARTSRSSRPYGNPWVLGRAMSCLLRDRFINFYGQHGARLSSRDSIYNETRERSLLFELFSPILFSAPDVHLKSLENAWVDKVSRKLPLDKLKHKLLAEWDKHTYLATILLTTNAAFLAIPNLAPGVSQTLSFLSTICGLGSVILALLLSRQHTTRSDTLESTADWLWKQNSSKRNLEPLAVMFALPYALLMWGMVLFLGGFLYLCYQSATPVIIFFVSMTWCFVGLLVLWCIIMAWQTGKWTQLFLRLWQKATSGPPQFVDSMRKKVARIFVRPKSVKSEPDREMNMV